MRKKTKLAKSIMAFAMAAAVAVSATGCGAKNESNVASSESTTSQSEPAATEAPATSEDTASSAVTADSETKTEDTKQDTAKDDAADSSASSSAASDQANTTSTKKPTYNTNKTQAKAPVQQASAAPAAAEEKKAEPTYTFVVRRHDASCTTGGYDEHICNEWGGMNYNDNYTAPKGHNWDNGVITKAATYTENGIKTFKCKDCGETRTEEIPALNKTYHIKEVVPATCTSEGYTIYECNEVPGLTYKADYTAKLPHSYDEGVITKAPTYTENGEMTYTCKNDPTHTYTEVIPAKGYTYTDTVVAPTCTEQGYTLHECNEDASMSYKDSYTDALGHDYKEVTTPATCKDEGSVDNVCERCGDTQHISTLPVTEDHQWNDGEITKAPTCTEAGEKTFTCTVCNKTKTEEVPATGHDYDEGVVTKVPTQTTSGIRTYTCKNCGDTYTETIPQLGHVWGRNEVTKQPTCEEDGVRTFYCTVDGCNETKTAPIPATGHDWDDGVVTKQATCTEDGSLTRTCKNDPTHTMTYTLYATGHTWDEGVVTKEPTHDENGIRTYTCTVCGATKTEEILATKYTFTVTVVEPTCTEQGYTYHKCNEDDSKSFTDNYTNALGHSGSLHTTPATCKEDGHTDYICDRCGYSELIETLPKTNNHSWDNGVVTVEPTADHEGVKTYTCSVCGETKTESIPRIASQSLVSVNPSDAEVETPVEAETPAVSEELPTDAAESDVPAENAEESDSEAVKQEDATLPKETEVEAIVVEEAAD